MSGTLYVVATPIGNLEDITMRALRVLREVAVIAAEDTRRTSRLLVHYGISTPTVSFHEHNTRTRTPPLVARLRAGESIAIVTDAGTPGVSDPGVELVRACIEAGITVDPIPGASATISALVVSGFPMDTVTLRGFPPSKGNARKSWLQAVAKDPNTVVIFESPHRIVRFLADVGILFGERPIIVARELTKIHQEVLRGTAQEVGTKLKNPKGEFTVVVSPAENRPKSACPVGQAMSPSQMATEFCHLTDFGGIGRRQAITELAKRHGKTAKEVYSLIESAKNSGE